MRPWRSSLLVLALLVGLSVVLTWPLAARLDTAVADLGDPVLTSWVLAWDLHALREVPLRLFDANMFHPHRWTLAYTEHLLGLVPLAAPARLLGGGPVLANNVVLLATFPLTGLAMFWLVRYLTGHAGAATVAAILYAFSHYRFGHLGHVQVLSHQWLPLLLLGLHRAATRGARWRDVALAAGAFTLQALSSGYHAHFAALAVAGFALWLAAPAARPPLGRLGRRGALAGTFVACVLAPAFIPYAIARHEVGLVRSPEEVGLYSARPASYLAVSRFSRWLGSLAAPLRSPEATLFPGGVMLLLAVTAAVTALRRTKGAGDGGAAAAGCGRAAVPRAWPRILDLALAVLVCEALLHGLVVGDFVVRIGGMGIANRHIERELALILLGLLLRRLVQRRPIPVAGLGWLRRLGYPSAPGLYVGLTVTGVLGSFGPTLAITDHLVLRPLAAQLYRLVPGFDALRVPGRFTVLVSTGLAVLAGYGAAAIARRLGRPALRGLVLAGLGALAVVETWVAPYPFVSAPGKPGPVDRWLAAAPEPGAVAVLPFYEGRATFLESLRLLGSTAHWRPLVNGYAGVAPSDYGQTVDTLNGFPSEAAVAQLRALYVRYVVVYLGSYPPEARARLVAALEELPPGITKVAAFENTAILEVGSPPRE